MVFADSVNIARRLSSNNEHDLVQENMIDKKRDHRSCKAVAAKLSNLKDLPQECFEYNDIVVSFQKRPTKSENSIAFEGMGSSAAAAAKARERGQQNYAQIQRRFTNTRRFTKQDK
mmetsp:Transcript_12140/g.17679  ORF Transcript_12140/g.17679 Transcript_12140/m.17679 type:complete len:116 (+) Transcript_12140:131-478(+)|eukprot:CAMPEP_0197233502 /NCGR_PEP_ID=MMETSP1429-20130617/1543_1 /TAXON_ID=49237 /ORGANISM="Chaetoceros  sp., Strain UNC1202" /LENGTH=115 /DNA_ID=CAMNT_0042691759 /DNA_START=131 /DNA_END=478 /DNA_ORIENTATION=-